MNLFRSSRRLLAVLVILIMAAAGAFAAALLFGQEDDTANSPLVPTSASVAAIDFPEETASTTDLPATFTSEPTATPSADPSPKFSPTPGPSPTPSQTPTNTPVPTNTPIPTETPTSLPQLDPTLSVTGVGRVRDGVPTPVTPIPSPVPTFEVPSNTTNILLLGSDTPLSNNDTRSDTIIIVAINRSGPTASMVNLQRDLFVYIPGRTMNRLNTAYKDGGIDLLKQTILYNFGIPIHYYARVDFQGFTNVVDAMGGVDIGLGCRFEDWRIKSPELDPEDEDNWERFALEPGIHHMDGDLALWYARSRLSTNDFHRARRQQQLLQAMFNQGVDLGLISQVPTLWNTFQDSIDTDIDIGRLLQLAALAPAVRENGVQHLYIAGKTQSWIVPSTGAHVQLPIWAGDDMLYETFLRLFLPPALSKTTHPPIVVEVVNATGNPDLSLLAADNLAWYGFVPVIAEEGSDTLAQETPTTQLRYFAANFKGSYDWLIGWVAGVSQSQIELVSDDDIYPYDYQLILGEDYNPCLNPQNAPQLFLNQ